MRDEFIETGKDSEGTKRQYVGSYIVKRITYLVQSKNQINVAGSEHD